MQISIPSIGSFFLLVYFLLVSVSNSRPNHAMALNDTIVTSASPPAQENVSTDIERKYPKNFWVFPKKFNQHPDVCKQRVEIIRQRLQIPKERVPSLHHQCVIHSISNLPLLKLKRSGPAEKGRRALLPSPDGDMRVRVVGRDLTTCDPEWRPSSLDSFFLKIVAEHLGSGQCFHMPGGRLGMIVSLGLGVMDIYDSSVYYAPPDHPDYKSLYPHAASDLCILVKRKERSVQNMLASFSGDLWAVLGASLLFYAGMLHLIRLPQPFTVTFRTFLLGSFDERQRPLANFLCVLLTAFGLIMVNAFLGIFMSFLATPREPLQQDTLEEVNAQVKRVYITPSVSSMLEKFDDDDVVKRLLEKYNPKWNSDEIQKDIRKSYDAAVILDAHLLEKISHLSENIDQNGSPLFHLVKECILKNSPSVYIVRHGWSLADRFSMKLQSLKEAGFYEKAQSDDTFMAQASGVHVPWASASRVEALSPRAMLQPAVVLVVGSLLSSVVFAWEVVSVWWRRRRLMDPAVKARQLRILAWTR